jgi:tetratricopeptide (TPR) repeat protein
MPPKAVLDSMQLVLDPWLESARILEEERALHPNFADVRHLLGLLYLERGEAAKACEELEAALAINPGYRRARFNLLVAKRMRDGSLDPAAWGEECPAASVEDPEKSLWTAWYLAQGGDRNGARAALAGLAACPSWSGLASYARAVWEQAWQEPRAARAALREAVVAHPLYREVLERRGLAPRRPGGEIHAGSAPMKDLSLTPLAEGAGWNPAAHDLFEYLGTICARNGRFEEALCFYDEAFLRDGRESLHLVRLAQLALGHGKEDDAVQIYCRAIEVDPTSVPARSALGFEYQSQGYPGEALVQFEVAARLRPEYPDIQYNLGLLYDVQGRPAEAERCLRRALEMNPEYFQARTTLARVLLQQERHPEALVELEKLLGNGIRSADLHVQKAQAHLSLDQLQDALEELESAVALNPTYARTYYILGQTYRQLGLRRKARGAWQQYLECSRRWGEAKPALEMEEWAL